MSHSKNSYLLNCPHCSQKFSESNLPKILPCGKTLCQECEQILLRFDRHENSQKFKCKLCPSEHNIPKINSFPTNEILFDFIIAMNSHRKSILKSQAEPNLRMNLAMNHLELNAAKLDTSIANYQENVNQHFFHLKNKINARTEKIVGEFYNCRDEILKDLETRKQVTFKHLNKNKEKIFGVQVECKKELKRLLDASNKATDDIEMRDIAENASDINEQLMKIFIYLEKCLDVKLINSKLSVDSSLIGELVNMAELAKTDAAEETHRSPTRRVSFTGEFDDGTLSTGNLKSKTICYKLPMNTKNMEMLVLNNRNVLKATELPAKDEFNFVVNVQLINMTGDIIRKVSINIGTFRMKKVKTNPANSHIAILLVNNLLSRYQLQLFNNNLKLIQKLDLHFIPHDIHLNEFGIYVQSANTNSMLHKYTYDLDHIRSFGQTSDSSKPFHVPKNLRLIGIQNDRLFLLDDSHLKLKLVNELNGKCVASIAFDSKNSQFWLDPNESRVYVLNESKYLVDVFGWTGVWLYQRRIDSRIQSLDAFFVLNNDKFAINDKRNRLIYIF